MKKSVYIATSLDGFIARNDGSLDWLPGSDGESAGDEDFGYQAFFDSVDTLIMGRNTYELVLSFGEWPYGDKQVIVLSRSLKELSGTLPDSVRLTGLSPQKLVSELETHGAKHVYIDGGRTIQGFLKAGLIDEITITRVPVLIGSGIPLFGPLDQDVNLIHIKTNSYENGFVQSQYGIVQPPISQK